MNQSDKSSNKPSDYHVVGWVKDAQGIKGEIFVRLKAERAEWLNELKEVRLNSKIHGVKTFELERARKHKNGLIVKMKGVNDRNLAETFKGYEFEIENSLLVSKPGESIYLNELLGFEVVDKNLGLLGLVKGFWSNGAQDLLLIDYIMGDKPAREIMIPFVKDFIENINFESKKIEMILPDGLLEN
ncbi:MAG: ribosome maturation factor RimM [Bdellovibrionales bacterium]